MVIIINIGCKAITEHAIGTGMPYYLIHGPLGATRLSPEQAAQWIRSETQSTRFIEEATVSEFTRLYRAEPSVKVEPADWIKESQQASGHAKAQGRWFVADASMLDWYKEDVSGPTKTLYVDVPTADLETYRVSNCTEQLGHRAVKTYSLDPENEFFLPRELADQAQPDKSDYDRMLDRAAERGKFHQPDKDHELER